MIEKFEVLIQGLVDSGYGIYDNFLDKDLADALAHHLITRLKQGQMKPAGIGHQKSFNVNQNIRGDLNYWLDPVDAFQEEVEFLGLVDQFRIYINQTCYTRLLKQEFQYAMYEKGSFYQKHKDQFQTHSGRQYTLVLYLNNNWNPSDSGCLVIHKDGVEIEIEPIFNRAVFFKSSVIEHEVKPTNTRRYSMSGWFRVD